MTDRRGLTVPLDGVPLTAHERVFRERLAAVPDRVLDDLAVIGTPEECRAKIAAYVDHGVTIAVLRLVNVGTDPATRAAEMLAMVRGAAPR